MGRAGLLATMLLLVAVFDCGAAEPSAPVVKFAPPFGLARGPVLIDGDPVEWGGMHEHPACGGTGVNQRFV